MSDAGFEVCVVSSDADRDALIDAARIAFADFGRPPEFGRQWVEYVGDEHARVVKRDGAVVGGLGILHFGHWIGGRRVPAAGITCVAVRPEARGSGAATAMMRHVVRELHAAGLPISSLFPSTVSLYRKAGYEPAAARYLCGIDVRALRCADRAYDIRPMTPNDHPAMHALHDVYARRHTGNVARGAYDWRRFFEFAKEPVHAFVVSPPDAPDRIEGYVIYCQEHRDGEPYRIEVRDLAFVTPAAGRRLLTYFADHGTMAGEVRFFGTHNGALQALAPNGNVRVVRYEPCMFRILDARAALAARGYPAGLRAEVHFELTDDLIEPNNGRFVLRVEDGRGATEAGGSGGLRLDIRAFAPLYTGWLSPEQLALAGMLDADGGGLEAAAAVFGGAQPWVSDRF